jgi:uncharacterized membrane protein YphA (DoxX/SURF4 family)
MDNYNSTPIPPSHDSVDTRVMELKDWLITLIISAIPCVGFIMLFVWAFSNVGNLNRKNYARAMLIFSAICIVLGFLLSIVFGAALFSISEVLQDYSY